MRIFVTRWFSRFARRERIADPDLVAAIDRAMSGLIDADLGGYLIKQRVARRGGGRSGGYRVLIALRCGERSVFLYGFAKSERENIDPAALADLKKLAKVFLTLTDAQIASVLREGELRELSRDDEAKE